MEILIVGAILMFILIYNNTIDKNKFFADNEKYLEVIREEDYTFLVYAKYGEDADADQLYMKRVTFAIVMFFIVLAFSMSGGNSLDFVNSQFFLNLVLSTVVVSKTANVLSDFFPFCFHSRNGRFCFFMRRLL